jgi:3-phosphoglycerate kinase
MEFEHFDQAVADAFADIHREQTRSDRCTAG